MTGDKKIFLISLNNEVLKKEFDEFCKYWYISLKKVELTPEKLELLKEILNDDIVEEGSLQHLNLLKKLDDLK